MTYPLISIIIASYNSDTILPLTLESIQIQSYPRKKLEILIVDGGSTDKTLDIARNYSCRIIHNPKIEPVSGKCLAYKKAKGDYLIYIDADEVIVNENSILNKFLILRENTAIKAVIGTGYTNPPNASFITQYINEFGDPFSFFMYRISKNSLFFIKELKKYYSVLLEEKKYIIFNFSKANQIPIMELGAANSMIDLKYVRKTFQKFDKETFAHLFNLIIKEKKLIAITKNDAIVHHTSSTLIKYLNKIKWRVKNNTHFSGSMGRAGYSGREKFSSSAKYKKYLFIFYGYSIIFPLVDALYLMYTRKNLLYIHHIFLTLFTVNLIVYHYILKLSGIRPLLRSYDEKKIIG
jgi:glycosyltransferase involved in cell wall biosynthesis